MLLRSCATTQTEKEFLRWKFSISNLNYLFILSFTRFAECTHGMKKSFRTETKSLKRLRGDASRFRLALFAVIAANAIYGVALQGKTT